MFRATASSDAPWSGADGGADRYQDQAVQIDSAEGLPRHQVLEFALAPDKGHGKGRWNDGKGVRPPVPIDDRSMFPLDIGDTADYQQEIRAGTQPEWFEPPPVPPLLLDALMVECDLDPSLMRDLLEILGFKPEESLIEDLSYLSAQPIAAAILAVEGPNPLIRGKLFAQFKYVAHYLGGTISHSFHIRGLYGEPLEPQIVESRSSNYEPPRDRSRTKRSRTRHRSRSPKRKNTKKKYEGVTQQGGVGADDEFEMLSEEQYADILDKYELVLGGKIPKKERPSNVQLSAVRSKLYADSNPAVEFAYFGPFGDRTAKLRSHVDDVLVDGVWVKRRFTGPSTIVELEACWRVFGTCMKALKASLPAPLEKYIGNLKRLNALHPDRFGILSQANYLCMFEEWPVYRQQVKQLFRMGCQPAHADPSMPWGAVIDLAAEDRNYWADNFKEPAQQGTPMAASAAAALQHNGYLTPMNNDGYTVMMGADIHSGAAGPYARRVTNTRHSDPLGVAPAPNWPAAAPWQPPAASSLTADRRPDGRLSKDPQTGRQLCFAYNTGRCSKPCPQNMSHVCEWCGLGGHTTMTCSQTPPGYVHPSTKGRGKHGGKAGGKAGAKAGAPGNGKRGGKNRGQGKG